MSASANKPRPRTSYNSDSVYQGRNKDGGRKKWVSVTASVAQLSSRSSSPYEERNSIFLLCNPVSSIIQSNHAERVASSKSGHSF